MNYYSLHNHTEYSNCRFLDSIARPEDVINRAIELGYKGIAFTEHESLSGAVKLLNIRDQIKEKHPDFKIIFGNEIYLIPDKDIHAESHESSFFRYYHFILIAVDSIGFAQLQALSSRAWQRGYYEKGVLRVPTSYSDLEEIVGSNPGHIIASSACLGSEVDIALLSHDKRNLVSFVSWCVKVFGKANFNLELQSSDSSDQKTVNPLLVRLARAIGLNFIVTTDSHYVHKEDFPIQEALLNSRGSGDREVLDFYKYTYLQSVDEIKSLLISSGLTEQDALLAISNTEAVGERCSDFDFRQETRIPLAPLPAGCKPKDVLSPYYKEFPILTKFSSSSPDQNAYFMYLIEKGIQKHNITIDHEKVARIAEELDVIDFLTQKTQQSFAGYLNMVSIIEDLIWQVSLIGKSRGSAGSYYVNYLAGIVDMDPLRYGIPSFRFASKSRVDWMDIDIDVQGSKNDDIIRILQDKFGKNCVLNCVTFKTEKLKSAILTVARAIGFNNDEASAIASLVPAKRGKQYTLEQCEKGDDELQYEAVPQVAEKLHEAGLYEKVKSIEGLISGVGIHASAVYIMPEGYEAYHNSVMLAPNGTRLTAFEMHDSDACGAMKFDLLKVIGQDKIRKCLDFLLKAKQIEWQGSLRSTYEKYLSSDVLQYDNGKIWDKIDNGSVMNLFQFETMEGGKCIHEMQPRTIEDLSAANAVVRLQTEKGQESPIERYIRFRTDINLWYKEMEDSGLSKEEITVLRHYLDKRYGCAFSQDDLMYLLMEPQIAGFTMAEADKARKIVSKKHMEDIGKLKTKFFGKEEEKK